MPASGVGSVRVPASGRLESWKEIAAYLNTSVRTVQRWEESHGLPVHRVLREKRSAVFAYPNELDAWLASRTTPPPQESGSLEVGPSDEPEAPSSSGLPMASSAKPSSAGPAAARPAASRPLLPLTLVAGLVVAGFVVAGLAAAGLALFSSRQPGPNGKPVEQALSPQRRSSYPGIETHPAESPDGQWLAYAFVADGRGGIALQHQQEADRTILLEGDSLYYSPQWSPDGKRLACLRRKSDTISELLLLDLSSLSQPAPPPRAAQPPVPARPVVKKLGEVLGMNWFDAGNHSFPALQWTPDGAGLLHLSKDHPEVGYFISLLRLATGKRENLLAAPAGAALHGFRLSPDGKQLAAVLFARRVHQLHTIALTSALRANGPWLPVLPGADQTEGPAWLPNGDLYFIRQGKQLWRRSGSAPPQPVPIHGPLPDIALAASADGKRLLWSHLEFDTAIWLYDLARQTPLRPLCDSTTMERMPRPSPSGQKVLFNSERDGALNIFTCDIATGQSRQLTHFSGDGGAWQAEWSPDGNFIVYDYSQSQSRAASIGVVSAEGKPVFTLSLPNASVSKPVWSFDGSRIFFLYQQDRLVEVRSVRPDGTHMQTYFQPGPVGQMTVRRDGKLWLHQQNRLILADPATGEQRPVEEDIANLDALHEDGLGCYYMKQTSPGISGNYSFWLAPGNGAPPHQLAAPFAKVMGYHIGPPGQALVVLDSGAQADLFAARLP